MRLIASPWRWATWPTCTTFESTCWMAPARYQAGLDIVNFFQAFQMPYALCLVGIQFHNQRRELPQVVRLPDSVATARVRDAFAAMLQLPDDCKSLFALWVQAGPTQFRVSYLHNGAQRRKIICVSRRSTWSFAAHLLFLTPPHSISWRTTAPRRQRF